MYLQTSDENERGIAQEMVEREALPDNSWTLDYLLKADASATSRCLSIVGLKRP